MKKMILLLACSFFLVPYIYSQSVAINANGALPDASAMLDVSSTTRGVLIPRMTTAQRTAIAAAATALMVFDTNTGSYWFKSSGNWIECVDTANNVWKKNGVNAYLGVTGRTGIGTKTPGYDIEIKRDNPNIGLYDLNDSHLSGSITGDSNNLRINAYQKPFAGVNVPGNLILQVNEGVGINSFIAGNIGIGITDPKGKLHVASNVIIGLGPSIAKGGLHLFDNSIYMEDALSNQAILLIPDGTSGDGEIQLFEDGGDSTVLIRASDGAGQSGEIIFIDPTDNTRTLEIDGDYSGTGRSRIIVDELQIKGGADLAEFFDVTRVKEIKPEAGMLVSIDQNNPGKLIVSTSDYDKKLAGVISGANGIKAGMMMGQRSTIADGSYPIALSGRVYVWAETFQNAINPGDLLTSSVIPGFAMKAQAQERSVGAIIGKAMGSMEAGKKELVLVLLNFQ